MITIKLEYKKERAVLPVNPDNIEITRSSEGELVGVVGVGEVAIPKTPEPATIFIASVFWQEWIREDKRAFPNARKYISWLKTWQASRCPAKLIVTDTMRNSPLNLNMWVVCDNFMYDVKAREEEDVYYELSLREYRKYGARLLKLKSEETDEVTVEPEVPEREDNSPPVSQTYVVKSGDCLIAIAKKLSDKGGANWWELYDIPENKKVIGGNPNLIYPGQEFIVPPQWVTE